MAVTEVVRRRLLVPTTWLSWGPLASLAAVALTISVPTGPVRYVPMLASAVVLGMPHGAVDYVALPRGVGDGVTLRWLAVVGAVYLVFGGAYALLWFVAPVAAAVLFVLLTWFHWGQGDRYHLAALYGADYARSRTTGALVTLVRGGVPMLVPLVAFPGRYRTVVASFVAPFGGSLARWPVDAPVRLGLGVGFAALTVATLALAFLRGSNRRAWRFDAAETLLLWTYFLVVPPVLAVGVYFTLWHSLRHVVRVVALDDASVAALSVGDGWTPLARFAREATPLTLAALALAGGLWVAVPAPSPTLAGVVAVYLVFVAVVTLPHTVVVSWLDRADGLL